MVSAIDLIFEDDDGGGDRFMTKANTKPNQPMINDANTRRRIFQPRILSRLLSLVSIPKLLKKCIRLISLVRCGPFSDDLLCELDDDEEL